MRAVLQYGIHDLRVEDQPPPVAGPGEVLIRIRSVTICASDVHIYAEGNVGGVSWDAPFIPGHEAAGVVEDPNGTELPAGTSVVLDPAAPCQSCDMCAEGNFHLCRDLKFLDLPPVHGAMRELLAWPADRVFPLPSSIDVVEAPLIEPLCVAIHALDLARDVNGKTVLIAGCGAIGLFALQVAKVRGAAKVLVSDRVPERLAVAAKLGADALIRIDEDDPAEVSFAATEGRGVDVSFEAAGPPEALQQCLDAVRPKGEVIVIGIPSEDAYHLRASELRRRELTVRFVRRQRENYNEALRLVEDGRVVLPPLLTHRFPFELAQQAFDLAERKKDGAIRVAVLP
ncbi:MAG: zinc-binding dehydrogenase [Armatimonadetes bacterium]|nr:zinc-binding dehydrogenase [Armatimonadota bacterium]